MKNSPYISLNEAAARSGRAKSTISKALKNGTLSYVSKESDTGQYDIDPAEVDRVFPKKQETATSDHLENTKKPHGNSAVSAELHAVQQQLKTLQLERDRERTQMTETIDDLRIRLDKSDEERTRLTLMLTDRQTDKPPSRPLTLRERLTGKANA